MARQMRFLVIGAGQRGVSYANPISENASAVIQAVAEPIDYRRAWFGEKYIWGSGNSPSDGQAFKGWREWLDWELQRRQDQAAGKQVPPGVDGVLVCTLDEMHIEIMLAIAPLNLHVLCEKPLATSLQDCLAMLQAYRPSVGKKIFAVGHVLRYSPHNKLLRKLLLDDQVIGEILSLEHTEPVGWQHFAHSYVRGNWRRQTANHDGSLLTKSCHDVDFILWNLAQPWNRTSSGNEAHPPRSITSTGAVNLFKKSRKPAAAGDATNCLDCNLKTTCQYSALTVYDECRLARGQTHWLNHVVPDIEDVIQRQGNDAARKTLHAKLHENFDAASTPDEEIRSRPWYGRCVYDADNDVADDQYVTIRWDEDSVDGRSRGGKTATLHMVANSELECERRGIVYGTNGELSYDGKTIRYFDFVTRTPTTVTAPEVPMFERGMKSHGGGDAGLANAFVAAVNAAESDEMTPGQAQIEHIGCTLEEAIMAHAVVFAAEEARRGEKVIKWEDWWSAKNPSALTNGVH